MSLYINAWLLLPRRYLKMQRSRGSFHFHVWLRWARMRLPHEFDDVIADIHTNKGANEFTHIGFCLPKRMDGV